MNENIFTEDFLKYKNNGWIWGCFYDENRNIVAQDIWGEIHKNILRDGN